MNYRLIFRSALALTASLVGSAAFALVNLDFRPNTQTVSVGQTVSIDLFAVSDNGTPQPFSILDVVLAWDPTKMNPISFTNVSSGYAWGNSGFLFPTLNGNLADGNAEWTGEKQLGGANPVATATGLLLTTFQFTALAPTVTATVLSMPAGLSGRTTRVFDPFVPNTNILGSRDPGAQVNIVPEPASMLALCLGSVALLKRKRKSV